MKINVLVTFKSDFFNPEQKVKNQEIKIEKLFEEKVGKSLKKVTRQIIFIILVN